MNESPLMPRRLVLFLCPFLAFAPAHAEEPNLMAGEAAESGAAAQLVLAQRLYRQASLSGDPVLLLAAIRLARGVTTRPAPGWVREGKAVTPPVPAPENAAAPDPGSDATLDILLGLASDDPDLQDLAYDLRAQLPQSRQPVATVASGGLPGGEGEVWRLPLSGAVAAEIALIGNGVGALGLTVTDESGAVVCAHPASVDPALCRFTPARNGFFQVRVTNAGTEWNSYRLVGN